MPLTAKEPRNFMPINDPLSESLWETKSQFLVGLEATERFS
jgi:hypothetical protein